MACPNHPERQCCQKQRRPLSSATGGFGRLPPPWNSPLAFMTSHSLVPLCLSFLSSTSFSPPSHFEMLELLGSQIRGLSFSFYMILSIHSILNTLAAEWSILLQIKIMWLLYSKKCFPLNSEQKPKSPKDLRGHMFPTLWALTSSLSLTDRPQATPSTRPPWGFQNRQAGAHIWGFTWGVIFLDVLPPDTCTVHPLTSFRILLKRHLLSEAFWSPIYKSNAPLSSVCTLYPPFHFTFSS